MREALKAGQRFMNASARSLRIVAGDGGSAAAQTNSEIEAYIRANALVANHVSRTVGMGKAGGLAREDGALNPDLTVEGVQGLQVEDASAFVRAPFIYVRWPGY